MTDWWQGGGGGSPVDVAAMLDSKALDVICDMVNAGALVSISTTSDGGALGLTITVDGRWRRDYFRDGGELVEWLLAAHAPVIEACGQKSASGSRGTRSRGSRGR